MTEFYPLLTMGGTLLLAVLIVGMLAVTWWFDVLRARLPQATRFEDLTQRNTSLTGQISEKQSELADIQRRIQDRDRVAAEVAALVQQREALHLEMAAMADAEQQIDSVKRRAADVAQECAEAQQKLEKTLAETQAAEDALKSATQQLAGLPTDQDALRRAIERLEEQRGQLENAVAELRHERATLLAAREEAAALADRKADLEADLRRMEGDHAQRKDALASMQAALAAVEEKKGLLQSEVAAMLTQKAEVQALAAERSRIEQDISAHSDTKQKLSASLQQIEASVAKARETLADLERAATDLRRMREEVDVLVARKAALAVEIEREERQVGGGTPDGENTDGELSQLPPCLAIHGAGPRPVQLEVDAIHDVCQSLSRHGLKYSTRTIEAFHTSLKINEVAQLTVLAGVSGTGKSLLPRRYAEAMGISFLPIAVEPRWDSPQDLLGFYNYVEKRYRGTDLARALVHMDPQNTSRLSKQPQGDRMLLVLLDEMNLARVEYYFSEFLSRLEIRPRWQPEISEEARRQASMPLDTRKEGGSVLLFPSHNVLFVGTMNDDESTQALSDKVLDRGNVMQFPAPTTFERPEPSSNEPRPDKHLEYRNWRAWIRRPVIEGAAEVQRVQDVINRLADIMQRCGRPFGHRLNEAMMTYVANYPRTIGGAVRLEEALADQIELRILPKLRGVVIDDGDSRKALEDVVALIRGLHDSGFADRLQGMLDGSMAQFNWRGLDRSRV